MTLRPRPVAALSCRSGSPRGRGGTHPRGRRQLRAGSARYPSQDPAARYTGMWFPGFGRPGAGGRPRSPACRAQEDSSGPSSQALSSPPGTALPLPTPCGYTVTYSLNVTVRQFAVTSVIIIFPKKGLNSLRGSSGSSWASAGGFSAAVGAAVTAAAVAGTSGFT